MKKRLIFVSLAMIISILLSLCLSIAPALTAFAAEADTDVVAEFKDGLSANMMIFAYNEMVKVDLEVRNVSADNISNVAVTLTLPEEFRCNEAAVTRPVNLDLMLNETKTLSYSIVNTLALPEAETTVVVGEKGGCGALISSFAVIFALICSAFFLLKNPKRGTACLLACLMLVPMALPIGAATTDRKLELEGIVASEEDINEEYENIAKSYNVTAEQAKEAIPADMIEKDMKVKKAVELVKEKAVVTEKAAEEKKEEAPKPKRTRKKKVEAPAEEAPAEAPAEEAKPE